MYSSGRRWRRRRRHSDGGGSDSDSGGGGGGGGDSDEDNDGYYDDGGGGKNGSDGLVCRRDHRTIRQNNGFGLREHCVLFIICDIIDGIHLPLPPPYRKQTKTHPINFEYFTLLFTISIHHLHLHPVEIVSVVTLIGLATEEGKNIRNNNVNHR